LELLLVETGHGESLQLTRLEGGDVQTGAGQEADTAGTAAFCIDRDSCLRESVDIAHHRSSGHLEALRQFGSGDSLPGL
jgi:hypothetical protein